MCLNRWFYWIRCDTCFYIEYIIYFYRTVFKQNAESHTTAMTQTRECVLAGTSNWSARLIITGMWSSVPVTRAGHPRAVYAHLSVQDSP